MGIRQKIQFYRSINWIKTLYFNYKKFPFAIAKKLPVYFYGPVKLTDITGEIVIDATIKRGMIGFGQPYELNTVHKGFAEIKLAGTIVFKGYAQFGKDYLVYVDKSARLELGNMAGIGSDSILVCHKKITLGQYVRVAAEARINDTDFHQMVNTVTGEKYEVSKEIFLGDFTYVSSRVKIMKGTLTPPYCTVASDSLCNKDYTSLGQNILIGGTPAILLRNNMTRDWQGEMDDMHKWLIL